MIDIWNNLWIRKPRPISNIKLWLSVGESHERAVGKIAWIIVLEENPKWAWIFIGGKIAWIIVLEENPKWAWIFIGMMRDLLLSRTLEKK